MIITKEIEIDMAHRVPNHKSKCRNLHGHRYKIEVGVDDKLINIAGDSAEGMVIDYSDLKNIMIDQLDLKFDHNSVFFAEDPFVNIIKFEIDELQNKKPHYVNFIPTAENLAKHWYQSMKAELEKVDIKIKHIKIWETPTSTATYEE